MTESEVVTSTFDDPTDPSYIGCYADTISDRVMSSVLTMADLTLEVKLSQNPSVSLLSACYWKPVNVTL